MPPSRRCSRSSGDPLLTVLSVSWTRDRIVFDPEAGPVRRNICHIDRRSRRTRSLHRLVAALDEDELAVVGIDAHAMHHFAKLAGSRYQDVVARRGKVRQLGVVPLNVGPRLCQLCGENKLTGFAGSSPCR